MKPFEELKAELLQNPEVRAEYERLRPEFEFEMEVIRMKIKQHQVHKSDRLESWIPAPRHFQGGSLVQFNPIPGAYSEDCAQALAAGKVGMVIGLCQCDYYHVAFGDGVSILCPDYYLGKAGSDSGSWRNGLQ